FRAYDDFAETGGVHCNQCHSKRNSDGISTLMWKNDWDFKTTLERLAEFGNVKPRESTAKPKPRPDEQLKFYCESEFRDGVEAITGFWLRHKPGITAEAFRDAGGG